MVNGHTPGVSPWRSVSAALAALALLVLAVAPALARTGANPAGRVVLDPDAPASVAPPANSFARRPATPMVSVGLPAGAIQVDSTWYDLQDMGSLGHRIQIGSDGRVHITWQDDFCELGGGCPPNLSAPQPHPNRGMGYAVGQWGKVGTSWAGGFTNRGKVRDTRIPTCCAMPDLAGGFGSLALRSDNRIAIAQHLNEDGCDLHGYFHLQDSPTSNQYRGYLTPVVSPSYLFPQVAANPNGSFTVLGEVPRGGVYDETTELRVSYLAAPSTAFSCFGWQMGAWTAFAPSTMFKPPPSAPTGPGTPAFPCIAASANGRVGVAVGDLGGNVYLIESSNGTFAAGTVTTRNLTNYSDATIVKGDSTSTQYRPYVHCHLAYNDTTPNVVWSEWQARKQGSQISYYDWRSRIRRWTPTRGVETVYQVPAGLADHYDDVDNGLAGPLPGFNTLSVDWPQIGFSPDGSESYIAFLRFSDAQVDPTANMGLPGVVTGIGFGEIVCSVERSGDYYGPQNLTNTPNTDERFFSIAPRCTPGRADIVFQASATNQAGCAIIGDRGTSPGNLLRRIAYLSAPLQPSSILAVEDGAAPTPSPAAIRVSPNPASSHSRIRLGSTATSFTRLLEVVDVTGRRMALLELPSGATTVDWTGRDEQGRAAPAGVYFARLAGDLSAAGTRFVLMR